VTDEDSFTGRVRRYARVGSAIPGPIGAAFWSFPERVPV